MSTAFRTQSLGYLIEGTYAQDDINLSTTPWYQYGKYTVPMGDLPAEIRELLQLYTGASPRPQDTYFSEYNGGGTISYTAVNAIPLYLALGKVTNAGSEDPYTHTIAGRDFGSDLPSITHRDERSHSGASRTFSIPGCYTQNLVYAHDFSRLDRFSTYQHMLSGTKITAADFAGLSTGLSIPGSHDDHYMQEKGTFATKWDVTLDGNGKYSSGGDDLSNIIQNFQFVVNNAFRPDKPHNQDYPSNYLMGNQHLIVSFDVLDIGSEATAVWDDFVTMQDNSTKKDMHYKIYQDATHYIQIDLNNLMLGRVQEKYIEGDGREDPILRCNALVEDALVTSTDPLAGATYYV